MFCSGVSAAEKSILLDCLHMAEAVLPVCYLGVPLISGKLLAADCGVLMDTISACINSWLAKLTFAGRL